MGWQFFSSEALDEAYVPFFGAFGAAWGEAMVGRWSVNPLGMLWPEMDAVFLASGGNGGPPATAQRPVVLILAADLRLQGRHAAPIRGSPHGREVNANDGPTSIGDEIR